MTKHIHVEREGHICLITLDIPEKLNALNAPACFELSAALDAFVADDELWVGIITGKGRAFCAGHDLSDAPDAPMPATGWAGISERNDIHKPLIAAVNGAAYGGGFEIALACDLIIATRNARFALSEAKWNGVALGGGVQRLQLRIPRNIANALMFTCKTMSAEDGERWGLVNELVAPGEELVAAKRWASDIIANAPLAVRHSKRLANEVIENEAFTALLAKRHQEVARLCFESEDIQEGLAAFREKRTPVWKGR
jgi:enoyl-CoA hydratase/carnithine racemase